MSGAWLIQVGKSKVKSNYFIMRPKVDQRESWPTQSAALWNFCHSHALIFFCFQLN